MTHSFKTAAVFVLLMCAVVVAAQETQKAPSIAGKWVLTLVTEAFTATPALDLKQDGEKITGTYTSTQYGAFPLTGTLKDRVLEFSFTLNAEGTAVAMKFNGEVAADGKTMKGRATIEGMGEASWTAERPKEK